MPELTPAPLRDSTRGPTPFADLNAVLAHWLSEVRRVLGDNFVGAYLQGSFAVGDADKTLGLRLHRRHRARPDA
ncbi:MAG TPA: hypothetical protein VGG68_03185 [Caulobacteraceae bacterium]